MKTPIVTMLRPVVTQPKKFSSAPSLCAQPRLPLHATLKCVVIVSKVFPSLGIDFRVRPSPFPPSFRASFGDREVDARSSAVNAKGHSADGRRGRCFIFGDPSHRPSRFHLFNSNRLFLLLFGFGFFLVLDRRDIYL